MEITGKIVAVLPAEEGVSKRTGNPWKSQCFVIETHDTYPRKCCFKVFGDERLRQFNIQMGEEMTVSLDIDAHEYNGRWYNDVRAWQVNRNPVVPQQAPQYAQQYAPQQAPQYPGQQAPVQQAAPQNGADDLPF